MGNQKLRPALPSAIYSSTGRYMEYALFAKVPSNDTDASAFQPYLYVPFRLGDLRTTGNALAIGCRHLSQYGARIALVAISASASIQHQPTADNRIVGCFGLRVACVRSHGPRHWQDCK